MEKSPLSKLKQLYETQYVSHADLQDFIRKHHLKSPAKSEITKHQIRLALSLKFSDLKTYHTTIYQLYHYLNHRDQLNQHFIKREQAKPYEIEGNKLDPQQIAAVVACEDAELILAPAGSGKTASLLAKLNYLTDILQIPAKDILIIAFTNKVVAELKDRVKQTNVEIRTFHSLGNKIVKAKYPAYKLITDRAIANFFHRTINHLYTTNHNYATKYDCYLHKNDVKDDATAFLDLINHSHATHHTDAAALETLFISILGLQKSERISLAKLKNRLNQIPNLPRRAKSLDFYHLYAPVVKFYAQYLKQNQLYDFADMLNLATDIITSLPKNSLDYQYILVDEAQDLSTTKYLLLKAILDKCKKVKLFAVGDDWQSIYRFAGSNLRVLDDFEQIFNRTTYRGIIGLTYRFGQPTAKLSNKFIQKNPHQSRKKVIPHVNRKTPIEIKLNLHKQPRHIPQDYETLNQQLERLYQEYGKELLFQKLQIISRYNRDIYRLVRDTTNTYKNAKLTNLSEAGMEFEWRIPNTHCQLKIPFCSIHKAKGITRDIIFLINMNDGPFGMPATRGDDPIAETLLTKLDAYPHAEERRLFYVAITRAKVKTIIISDASRISPFVYEISPRLIGAGVKVCPKCHRGIMLERHRRDGKIYYSCSNYSGGCRHTEQ